MRGGLCDEMGYGIGDLAVIFRLMVSSGGLKDTDVKAGETVIVSPATGGFGGAALFVALAMGARGDCRGERYGGALEHQEEEWEDRNRAGYR